MKDESGKLRTNENCSQCVIPSVERDPAQGRRGALASVATATRYDSVACDERSFSSSEERASAPLGLSPQRSMLPRATREFL